MASVKWGIKSPLYFQCLCIKGLVYSGSAMVPYIHLIATKWALCIRAHRTFSWASVSSQAVPRKLGLNFPIFHISIFTSVFPFHFFTPKLFHVPHDLWSLSNLCSFPWVLLHICINSQIYKYGLLIQLSAAKPPLFFPFPPSYCLCPAVSVWITP